MEKFGSDSSPAGKDLSLSEKMKYADADQKEYEAEVNTMIARLKRSDTTSGDIHKEMRKLDSLLNPTFREKRCLGQPFRNC